uniref:Uncharacterized protein n=1 Tax=Anguilla anguilla TaxID=7936 RepID=A0A0E9S698_ANGAN
MPYPILYI